MDSPDSRSRSKAVDALFDEKYPDGSYSKVPPLLPLPITHTSNSQGYLFSRELRLKCLWVGLYFCFNLLLTLHNKYTMIRFPFPYLLTAVHSLSNCVGIMVMWFLGQYKPTPISLRTSAELLFFSALYALNIAISNSSLGLVTVPVHQIVRASTPIMVVLFSFVLFHKRYTQEIYLSLTVVAVGIGFATFGDYSASVYGLCLTIFGSFLAALKTIVTSSVLKSSKALQPLDLLLYLSPLAFIQMFIAANLAGEVATSREYSVLFSIDRGTLTHLAMNAAVAFGMNVVSFTAIQKTGPVAISVAANVKQVFTIILAIGIFSLDVGFINIIGMAVTLLGGAWYARIEFLMKKKSLDFRSPIPSPKTAQTEF